MNQNEQSKLMPCDVLLSDNVFINGIRADVKDRLELWKNIRNKGTECRIYRYNGIIDIVVQKEVWYEATIRN